MWKMRTRRMRTDRVRITVGAGPPVLQVAVAILRHLARDPDAAAPGFVVQNISFYFAFYLFPPVGDSGGEVVN